MDVKSAYLNGYLEEEVYIEPPPGFNVEGQEHKINFNAMAKNEEPQKLVKLHAKGTLGRIKLRQICLEDIKELCRHVQLEVVVEGVAGVMLSLVMALPKATQEQTPLQLR
ncbi:hypothetical protein RJ639_018396 [Escallonia herrerae]|uniref:Reverse transcriptase Ty1/copia-type domain-containing protein n=1 Tax=Escallonia herrerae TaxID=1293975 RepID=A0AA88V9K3_9ASTE|nr:hypothetical protein RJ639_018396 [Escallonia herrerae]